MDTEGSREGLTEGQGRPREKPKSDLATVSHPPLAHPEGAENGCGLESGVPRIEAG